MKFYIIFIFIFIINCSGNKVSNYHGTKFLEVKYKEIEINVTNKNDLLKIIGPPSTVSDFDENKWFYFERLKTNQSLIKLGNSFDNSKKYDEKQKEFIKSQILDIAL